jgi:hypothetical protein
MTPAKQEMAKLLGKAILAAEDMLGRDSDFGPFSMVLAPDGKINIVGTVHVSGSQKTVAEEVAITRRSLSGMASAGLAVACVIISRVNMRVAAKEPVAAVLMEVEHKDGGALDAFLPYTWDGNRPVLGEMVTQQGAPKVFLHRDQT